MWSSSTSNQSRKDTHKDWAKAKKPRDNQHILALPLFIWIQTKIEDKEKCLKQNHQALTHELQHRYVISIGVSYPRLSFTGIDCGWIHNLNQWRWRTKRHRYSDSGINSRRIYHWRRMDHEEKWEQERNLHYPFFYSFVYHALLLWRDFYILRVYQKRKKKKSKTKRDYTKRDTSTPSLSCKLLWWQKYEL